MGTIFEEIKNQDYGSNDEIENKLKFDKRVKNQNLKSKHQGPNFNYHQNLNWKVKLERKNKFTKESKLKIRIKRMRIKFEKIKNQNYRSNDEIENKLKFDISIKNQT